MRGLDQNFYEIIFKQIFVFFLKKSEISKNQSLQGFDI